MIPFTAPLWLKAIGGFLSTIPRWVWGVLAIGLIAWAIYAKGHRDGVEAERKVIADAQAAAAAESAEQEKAAPGVAQKAQEDVAAKTKDRVRVIRETITVPADCPAYPDRVQDAVREARAAADSVR